MINTIKNDLINGDLNSLIISNIFELNRDLMVKDRNMIYQLTSSYNQNNNEYNNDSTIKLGECENILRKYYNLTENDSLIIFKIEKYEENLLYFKI